MFGMIHRSARDMVLELFGQVAWDQILDEAGLDDGAFVSAQSYPDEVTFRLITAAAGKAGLTVDQTLQAFGRHWIKAAEKGPYANVMRMLGSSLLESLMNLDRMHASIQIAMPGAQLPQFAVVSHDEQSIEIAYHSRRAGLEQFVCGLLEGLMERFHLQGSVGFSGSVGEARMFTMTFADPVNA
jgi:hypothetical protein